MKSKAIMMLIVIILSVIFCNQVNASSNIKILVEGVKDVEKNSTITAIIRGENLENSSEKLSGLKFDLYYDNEQLEYVSSKKGDAVSNVFDLSENYSDEGRVRVGIVTLSSIETSGIFYEITFEVKDTFKEPTGTFRIDIKEASTAEGNELNVETQNGTITYIGDFTNENNAEQENELNLENDQKTETENNFSNQEENTNNEDVNQENENEEGQISENKITNTASNTNNEQTTNIDTQNNNTDTQNNNTDTQNNNMDTQNNNIYYIIIGIIVILAIVSFIIIKRKRVSK